MRKESQWDTMGSGRIGLVRQGLGRTTGIAVLATIRERRDGRPKPKKRSPL
ncbi:MAG: hypothetical protein ACRERE_10895 [Candidatus Entotheonellia bacterium]